MKVIWTSEAERDRIEVVNYIATDNLRAAAKMDELFGLAAARLAKRPKSGRPGKVPGTRELIPPTRAIAWCMKSRTTPSGFWRWCIHPVGGRQKTRSDFAWKAYEKAG